MRRLRYADYSFGGISEGTDDEVFETLAFRTFVRVHRSTIVNVTQISRVELFGKNVPAIN